MFRQESLLPDPSSATKIADFTCTLALTSDGAICEGLPPLIRFARDGSLIGKIEFPEHLRGSFSRVLFGDHRWAIIAENYFGDFTALLKYDFATQSTTMLSCSTTDKYSFAVANDHLVAWYGPPPGAPLPGIDAPATFQRALLTLAY